MKKPRPSATRKVPKPKRKPIMRHGRDGMEDRSKSKSIQRAPQVSAPGREPR